MTTAPRQSSSWLRCFHPAPRAKVRLFCLPHAGGTAGFFHAVSAEATPDIEVHAVQYPGRQDRLGESCYHDMQSLAQAVAAEILPETEQPYALFGHSMGAALGYEVAQILAGEQREPAMLFVSGRRAPSTRRHEYPRQLDDAALLDELSRLGGTDTELMADPRLRDLVMPSLRSDYQIIENYRSDAAPSLRSPITAMLGDADPQVSLDEADAWRSHSLGGFSLHEFRGGHFYLTERVTESVAVVRSRLDAVLGR